VEKGRVREEQKVIEELKARVKQLEAKGFNGKDSVICKI